MITILGKREVTEHFLKLSPEDRYCRFCHPATDDYIKKYVENARGSFYGIRQLVIPKVEADPSGWVPSIYMVPFWEVAGVVHVVPDSRIRTLEVAVSVLPQYRGRGYSKQMMFFAMGIGEAHGCNQLQVSGLSSNSAMIGLAKECGYVVKSERGEFEGTAETITSNINTIIQNQIKIFTLALGKTNEPT